MKIRFKELFGRIEFWIFFFFLLRLVGITNPPLEANHNWRQAAGLMVARNFLEVDANILYPRIDDHRGTAGIIGMEFPTLNYLHFLVAKLFGYQHWYGRLINLIVSSVGLFYFYRILIIFFSHRHAFTATLCLIGSLWFAYSRKMMPDTFCISLMFIGIYYAIQYLNSERIFNLLASIFFISIAVLSKIPAGIYMAVFVPLFLSKYNLKAKVILAVSLLVPISLSYIWYFIWNPYLSAEFHNWYNIGEPLEKAVFGLISNIDLTLERYYFSSFNSFIMFGIFLVGLFLMLKHRNKQIIWLLLTISFVFILYMLRSGYYFYHHSYYIIPFVPVMAVIAGYALSTLKNKTIYTIILALAMFESIANQNDDFFIPHSAKYKLKLPEIADSISQKTDLIVINSDGNPQQMYLAHRKGWNCENYQLTDADFLEEIAEKGCKFIFVNKKDYPHALNNTKVFEDEHFVVYKIPKLKG